MLMANKISIKLLETLIIEELTKLFEQGQVPVPSTKGLEGDTFVGQQINPQQSQQKQISPGQKAVADGSTYVAPANGEMSAGQKAIADQGTYVAPAGKQQSQGTVPAATLINIKKQLSVLTSEIDKVLNTLGKTAKRK